ncbi:MAG: DEAD/DEAH box helicase [Spirochaetes bacterium]|nr:DEAD/DEAH box helicase [Spirochaetota bacterium]
MDFLLDKLNKESTVHDFPPKLQLDKFYLFTDQIGTYIRGQTSNKNREQSNQNENKILKEINLYIQHIINSQFSHFDWAIPSRQIYLHQHPQLLSSLLKSNRLYSAEEKKITLSAQPARLFLQINKAGKNYKCSLLARFQNSQTLDFTFINDSFIYTDNKIYPIPPIGTDFMSAQGLNCQLSPENLENYLSIFFSYFPKIPLDAIDFSLVKTAPVHPEPILIFHHIDANQYLHLKLSATISNLDPQFFQNYQLTTIAAIDQSKKQIIIAEISHRTDLPGAHEVNKLLNQCQKKLEIKNGFFFQQNYFVIQPELAQYFIQHHLSHLSTHFKIYGTDTIYRYQFKKVQPKIKVAFSRGINYLEGKGNLEIEGQSFSIYEAISLYKKNHYIPLLNGEKALINHRFIEKLERLFTSINAKEITTTLFDLPLLEEIDNCEVTKTATLDQKDFFQATQDLSIKRFEHPPINGQLRDYQYFGYQWLMLLNQYQLSGCLADDMGLGKTVQVLSLLTSLYPKKPHQSSLIILPRTLIFNWLEEIKKFCPELTVYTYYQKNRNINEAMGHQVILTTYTLIRNDNEIFREREFYYIVLDEAQSIKNLSSQITRAVHQLKSRYRIAISGTPVENNLTELYSIFSFLNQKMFKNFTDFNRKYTYPIEKENDSEAIRDLRKKIQPFTLRRLKKEVAKDLPDKVEQTLFVDMNPAQKKLYLSRKHFFYHQIKGRISDNGLNKSQIYIFQAMNELRQIAAIPELKSDQMIQSSKRELLREHIEDITANGHKALVFSNYISSLENISNDLKSLKINYLLMSGATKNRQALVNQFQSQSNIKVLLMTLKVGGVGINLTEAEYVYIFDPWWNFAAEQQAVDRAYRIGQKNTVFCYKIITKDSIEEKIYQLQNQKRELFDHIFGTEKLIQHLNEKDIDFLMGD